MVSRLSAGAATLAVVAVFALAGCADDTPPAPGTGSTSPAIGVTPPVASSPATDCGGLAAEIREKLVVEGMQSVEVTGQCTTVVIGTSLGDADGTRAKDICDAAAEIAYTGNVNSIRVEGSSGKELSQGMAGAPCVASP
jgi:hypothetical protein